MSDFTGAVRRITVSATEEVWDGGAEAAERLPRGDVEGGVPDRHQLAGDRVEVARVQGGVLRLRPGADRAAEPQGDRRAGRRHPDRAQPTEDRGDGGKRCHDGRTS